MKVYTVKTLKGESLGMIVYDEDQLPFAKPVHVEEIRNAYYIFNGDDQNVLGHTGNFKAVL